MPSHPFTKTQRVRRRSEFQQIFKNGYRVGSRYFTLLLSPNAGSSTRLGIVASRKLGDAVHRNRAKRLIRELFRLNDTRAAGIDYAALCVQIVAGAALDASRPATVQAGAAGAADGSAAPHAGAASNPAAEP